MIKKVTMEKLAEMMQEGFRESNIRTDRKIDGLALMVQKGFEQTATKEELHEVQEVLSSAIKDLEMRMSAYLSFNKEEIDHLKSWMEGIEARIASLEIKNKSKK